MGLILLLDQPNLEWPSPVYRGVGRLTAIVSIYRFIAVSNVGVGLLAAPLSVGHSIFFSPAAISGTGRMSAIFTNQQQQVQIIQTSSGGGGSARRRRKKNLALRRALYALQLQGLLTFDEIDAILAKVEPWIPKR